MLTIYRSLLVFAVFTIVCVAAYFFSFHLLFFHSAFEVFYYGALFFGAYIIAGVINNIFKKF